MYCTNAIVCAAILIAITLSFAFKANYLNVIYNMVFCIFFFILANVYIYLTDLFSKHILKNHRENSTLGKLFFFSIFNVFKYLILIIPFLVVAILYHTNVTHFDKLSIYFSISEVIAFCIALLVVGLICRKNKE
jgi:hypothetical protein